MAETTDERWRSCQALGDTGRILATHPEELDKVYDLLKDCAKHDDNGMVRYHAVISLAKLCPFIQGRRPDMVFEICNLLIGDGAKTIGQEHAAGIKDAYDRVRRGTMHSLFILVELPNKRDEMRTKIREALSKHLVIETYDIVRMDCYTLIGKIGPPVDKIGEKLMVPLDDIAAKDAKGLGKVENFEIFVAKLARYKLERCPEWKTQFPKDINLFIERSWIQFEHWSYWPQRECLARALGELGPLLTRYPKTLNQVLTMLENLAGDPVFDVRVAACKAFGDFIPNRPSADGGGTSKSAVQRLGPAVWERAAPILEGALRNDASPEVQEAARKALLNRPEPRSPPTSPITSPRSP